MAEDYLKEYGYSDTEITKILNSKYLKKFTPKDLYMKNKTFKNKHNISKE